MKNNLAESIQRSIDYTQKELENTKKTINYYKQVGAKKDLTWELGQVKEFETEIENLTTILKDGPTKFDGVKVRVTEYKGNIVIETIDPEVFDLDFNPDDGGSIGCTLLDVERLAISVEAVNAIRKLKRVGDSVGDFMNGASDYFSWIGETLSVKDSRCVVSRDFVIPFGYVEIENETSDKAMKEIDGKVSTSNDIDYKDLEHEIWIEIYEHSGWDYKDDDPKTQEYKRSDFHTVQVKIHEKYIDADLNILNEPEGCVYPYQMHRGDDSGRQYKLSDEEHKEITGLAKECFKGMEGEYKDSYGWSTSGYVIPKDQVMSFVNGLFEVGFDNNIMNPKMNYWRMSMQSTTSKIKKALKSFKRI